MPLEVLRMRWGAATLALAATSLLGVGTATAAATRTMTFQVDGSKNHTIYFTGTTGEFGGGFVNASPNALNDSKNTAYSLYRVSDATVSRTEFVAKFGSFGRVNTDFKPTDDPKAIPVPSGCQGEPGKVTKGVFKGPIEFKGEGGYTNVDLGRARGRSMKNVQIESCRPPKTHAAVALAAGDGYPAPGFAALRKVGSANVVFGADVSHSVGDVEISRLVNRVGPSSQFNYNNSLSRAHVDPPAPFSGEADFKETGAWGADTGTFTGSLQVSFPGEKNVALAKPGTHGALRKSETFGPLRDIFP
jgi:hypothetical protein